MNKTRLLVLIVGVSLVLACAVAIGPESPTTVPQGQSTLPPLPTYTPYPTYTPVPPQNTLVPPPQPTATSGSSSISPKYPATLLEPNDTQSGNTKLADELYYFVGQAGKRVTITVIGDPRYQTFSLRDSDNKGLVGCDITTQTICIIKEYVLPYSGVYYVLVDRTFVDNYRKLQSCVTNPPYADWCYRGGSYTVTLEIR
jgi:hypothetical protein